MGSNNEGQSRWKTAATKLAGVGFLAPSVAVGLSIALVVGQYRPLTFDAASIVVPEKAQAVELKTLDVEEERQEALAEQEEIPPTAVSYSAADYGVDTSKLKDGTYTGSGQGYRSSITVQVVVSDGKIASISVVSSGDDEPYFSNARAVIDRVISAQSTSVDVVSGATYSSKGILVAIRNALVQAGSADAAVELQDAANLNPEGGGAALEEALPDDEEDEGGEAGGGAGSAEADGNPIAPEAPVVPGEEDGAPVYKYADGVFTGVGEGYKGPITVQVTVASGAVTEVKVTSHNDDVAYYRKAKALLKTIVAKQSTEIDVVSGATFSSRGIIEATEKALKASEELADAQRKQAEADKEKGDGSGGTQPAGPGSDEGTDLGQPSDPSPGNPEDAGEEDEGQGSGADDSSKGDAMGGNAGKLDDDDAAAGLPEGGEDDDAVGPGSSEAGCDLPDASDEAQGGASA